MRYTPSHIFLIQSSLEAYLVYPFECPEKRWKVYSHHRRYNKPHLFVLNSSLMTKLHAKNRTQVVASAFRLKTSYVLQALQSLHSELLVSYS